VAGSCGYGDETPGSIELWGFLEYLSNCLVGKKDAGTRSECLSYECNSVQFETSPTAVAYNWQTGKIQKYERK
jgi:hypothetical protein